MDGNHIVIDSIGEDQGSKDITDALAVSRLPAIAPISWVSRSMGPAPTCI